MQFIDALFSIVMAAAFIALFGGIIVASCVLFTISPLATIAGYAAVALISYFVQR